MDAIKLLLRSRKFLLLAFDVIISFVLYFVGKYADPAVFEDIKFLIAGIQPVFIALIGAIAYEDGKLKSNPASIISENTEE